VPVVFHQVGGEQDLHLSLNVVDGVKDACAGGAAAAGGAFAVAGWSSERMEESELLALSPGLSESVSSMTCRRRMRWPRGGGSASAAGGSNRCRCHLSLNGKQ
jgi:hypothetical protein